MAGSCEHSNEPTGSIKGREFLDHLSDYQIPKDCSMELVMVENVLRGQRDVNEARLL
jgi:hypothetical protein